MRKASCQTIFVLNLQNHSFNKEITRNVEIINYLVNSRHLWLFVAILSRKLITLSDADDISDQGGADIASL